MVFVTCLCTSLVKPAAVGGVAVATPALGTITVTLVVAGMATGRGRGVG